MTKQELQLNIKLAQGSLNYAEKQLSDFEALAENNVYESIDDAGALEEILRERAFDDCEGAGNCGDEVYTQEFTLVNGDVYCATLTVEYNRHDKTYYYIDGSSFEIVLKS